MAWNTQRTWADGDYVTAAYMNRYVRDALLETLPALATTEGDIFYATAANALARLADAGDDDKMLRGSVDGEPEWSRVAAFWQVDRSHSTSAFKLGSGWQDTEAEIEFDPGWDTYTMFGWGFAAVRLGGAGKQIWTQITDDDDNYGGTTLGSGGTLQFTVAQPCAFSRLGNTGRTRWRLQVRETHDGGSPDLESSLTSATLVGVAVRTG